MANAWVYHGPTFASDGGYWIYDGHLLFVFQNNDAEWDQAYVPAQGANIWYTTGFPGGLDYNDVSPVRGSDLEWHGELHHIAEFNQRVWGNEWAYAGGSMYSIRYGTWMYNSNRSRQVYLPPSSKVIIGQSQGYTLIDSPGWDFTYIRAWGYVDTYGNVHETYGLFVANSNLRHPDEYQINTW